jgi:DNA polymerase-4
MDAFFASVEIHDDPALAGKPVIVGGTPEGRGVVAAASYEARKFGVHSAMPAATAVRLCPHAVFLPARGERYAEVSRAVMTILGAFTPLLEQISVDEAFLDVTASRALFGPPETIARTIKERVRAGTGLTCSVGVAPNKFLAKVASDLEKPDGLTVIPDGAAAVRLAPLPVRRIWGVGPKTAARLEGLGLRTIGQVAACDPARLAAELGSWAAELQALARGEDDRPVETGGEAKSLSRETTFAVFLSDRERIESVLLALADDVAERLRADGLAARVVTLKVRDETFKTVTREATLDRSTDLCETLYAEVVRLFREKVALGGRKVRLLGVGATGLAPRDAGQQGLFPDPADEKRRHAAQAVDRVKKKYGEDAVTRARLLKGKGLSGRGGWEGA